LNNVLGVGDHLLVSDVSNLLDMNSLLHPHLNLLDAFDDIRDKCDSFVGSASIFIE
jgi:hypothetical protein